MLAFLKKTIKTKFPRLYRLIIMAFYIRAPYYVIAHNFRLLRIKRRKKACVVFFISSLGMWRYERLFKLLSEDSRFKSFLLIQPFGTYSKESQLEETNRIKRYFNQRNINYIDMTDNPEEKIQWFCDLKADILFYPQAYYGIYANKLDPYFNRDKLFCYCPYGIVTLEKPDLYNEPFQNISWKLFYPTKYHLIDAKHYAYNKGKNVIVSGDPNIERFTNKDLSNPWKNNTSNRKRLIWAPHFTITGNAILYRSSFLLMCNYMIEFADKYKDKVQIAFKPHPRLKSELYKHPLWGKTKTDAYYEYWNTLENGQLEEGDYAGLFYYSDAMIHDCGSFSAEYLYVNKPCIFVSKDIDSTIKDLNRFGKECINLHLIASNIEEIDNHLKKILFDNEDINLRNRTLFIKNTLTVSNNHTCAELIYNNILNSLHFDSLSK